MRRMSIYYILLARQGYLVAFTLIRRLLSRGGLCIMLLNFYATVNSDYNKDSDCSADFIKPGLHGESKKTLNILKFIPKSYEISRLQKDKKVNKSRRSFIKKKIKKELCIYEEILDDVDQEYEFLPILSTGETVDEFKRRLTRPFDNGFSKNSTKQGLLQVFKSVYLRHIEILRLEKVKKGAKNYNKIKADNMEKRQLPTLLKRYQNYMYDKDQLCKIIKAELRQLNNKLKQLKKKERLKNEIHKLIMTIGFLNQDTLIKAKR